RNEQKQHAADRSEVKCQVGKAHGARPRQLLWLIVLLASSVTGCAAFTNPLKDGISASQLPPELLAEPKNSASPLPLVLLGQDKPAKYTLGPGDTLGI